MLLPSPAPETGKGGRNQILTLMGGPHGVHHCLIVVAQISDRTLAASRSLKNADALPMPQKGFMKIVNDTSVLGKERLQESMGSISSDFFPDKPDTH